MASAQISSENRNRIELLEEHFRAGRFEPAELLLSILSNQKLPPSFAVRVAEIARRAGQSRLALETLRKSMGKKPILSAPAECIAEFAANLGVLGDWKTSEKLFSRAQLSQHAAFALPRAIALMNGWEFEAAIPLLRITIAQSENPASRVSAQLRLATCLLRSGEKEAVEESNRIIESFLVNEGKEAEFVPQKVYAIHLKSEWLYFAQKDTKAALQNIEKLIKEFPKHDQTIPRTWQLLLSIRIGGMKPEWTSALQTLREETLKNQQPHLIRMMDLLSATLIQEPGALARLWFGSPYPGVRKLLQNRVAAAALPKNPTGIFPLLEDRPLSFSPPVIASALDPESSALLDLSRGSFKSHRENPFLKLGQSSHRLLMILCSDFYRPIPTVEIFSGLYPDEIFEPGPAETRVHAQVSRARKLLHQEAKGLTIEPDPSGAGYLIKALPLSSSSKKFTKLYLVLPNPGQTHDATSDENPHGKGVRTLSRLEFELDSLKTTLLKSPTQSTSASVSFGSEEAAKIWEVSIRSANTRIKEALESGKIEKQGKGPSTRYVFKK